MYCTFRRSLHFSGHRNIALNNSNPKYMHLHLQRSSKHLPSGSFGAWGTTVTICRPGSPWVFSWVAINFTGPSCSSSPCRGKGSQKPWAMVARLAVSSPLGPKTKVDIEIWINIIRHQRHHWDTSNLVDHPCYGVPMKYIVNLRFWRQTNSDRHNQPMPCKSQCWHLHLHLPDPTSLNQLVKLTETKKNALS